MCLSPFMNGRTLLADAGDTPEAVLDFWQGMNYSCRPSKSVSRTDLRSMFTGRDVGTDILCTNLTPDRLSSGVM